MDSPGVTPGSAQSTNDENPRVKFLCSFSGSILPRPQDGKLRYVGGETRIVSIPRDISYEDLMGKMRELYEGVIVLKYQQPDEDLDALVSVVNDDDVINMMEEYDKLGSGDGFTRLRIFLFSSTDQDGSLHFGDGDERDHERRYVDALNSLNDSPEFRSHPFESPIMGSFDDIHAAEPNFNQMNLEGSVHGQRNMELPMAQMNLRHLTIPRTNTQIPVTQRYSEMEAPWSPAYYSPRQPENMNQRPVAEFSTSPSSCRYRTPYADCSDRNSDRMPEDYARTPINTHTMYEQQPQYTDNVMLVQTGPVINDKTGFPGNILQGTSGYEGNSTCNNCRVTFNRTQVFEPPNVGNGYHNVPGSCAECPPGREVYLLNTDPNIHPSYYNRDQSDPRFISPETHTHDREWVLPHQQANHLEEESRPQVPVNGRLSDNYVIEGSMSMPLGHATVCDGPPVQSPYFHHEDQRYARSGVDYGSQVFQGQSVASGPHIYMPSVEDHGSRYGNPTYPYGSDNLYQVPHGHIPSQTMWRNIHNPLQGRQSYETSIPPLVMNGSMGAGFVRGTVDSTPRVHQNHWVESSQKAMVFNGSSVPEQSQNQAAMLVPNTQALQTYQPQNSEPIQSASNLFTSRSDPALIVDNNVIPVAACRVDLRNDNDMSKVVGADLSVENGVSEGYGEINHGGVNENSSFCVPIPDAVTMTVGAVEDLEANASTPKEIIDGKLRFLPALIASVKEAAVHNVEEVKAKVQDATAPGHDDDVVDKDSLEEDANAVDGHVELEVDSDTEHVSKSKIEPTKAEAEAIDRGLQTIKNEDLEEIRELGSGTYGSVYHGKWRGSDVAIKRIKASCFAGKPSERERLIADFWKEAQILSSLHHPNVVSFYGVVRDGPDGSLATVTEFMINGSLKQFLQKKDRTIDRRKRLIIGMDTAFGMEYLHGKNIVHFDLKCENLLVNMRDPHRPVCKIGDLGLSKVKQHTLVSGGVRGTLPWMAPELLSGKSNMVTEKIDVYSFGIVMWELLTGDEPYADMHCASIIGGIVNNTLRPQIPTWCDPEWKALMESCWASDPAQRPSFSEISQKLRTMAAAMNLK